VGHGDTFFSEITLDTIRCDLPVVLRKKYIVIEKRKWIIGDVGAESA
jgi:hypothetical protein